MRIPLDLCSTEDHDYHLQNEADVNQMLFYAPAMYRSRASRVRRLSEHREG